MLYFHQISIRNSLRLGFLLFPYKSLSFLGLWKSCHFVIRGKGVVERVTDGNVVL
jgi:hypothetical protein